MPRFAVLLLALSWLLDAATIRLFLKDGSYHIVREYKVVEDRVRFYSEERRDWEEIPLELVDLKRTAAVQKEREDTIKKDAAMQDAEEKAIRAAAEEVAKVPQNTGVYYVDGQQLVSVKQADSKVVNNRRRSVLKAITPIPIVAGKSTVELDGERSAFVVTTDKPEFYIRLTAEQRFGIARLAPGKKSRIVQYWEIIPVANEIMDKVDLVESFKRQVDDGVYKIWPLQPLTPGEYAVVEYTEGKGNIQIWDFSYQPGK